MIVIHNLGCNDIVKFNPKFFEINKNEIKIKTVEGAFFLNLSLVGEMEIKTENSPRN